MNIPPPIIELAMPLRWVRDWCQAIGRYFILQGYGQNTNPYQAKTLTLTTTLTLINPIFPYHTLDPLYPCNIKYLPGNQQISYPEPAIFLY
jgi:hypothetical protein